MTHFIHARNSAGITTWNARATPKGRRHPLLSAAASMTCHTIPAFHARSRQGSRAPQTSMLRAGFGCAPGRIAPLDRVRTSSHRLPARVPFPGDPSGGRFPRSARRYGSPARQRQRTGDPLRRPAFRLRRADQLPDIPIGTGHALLWITAASCAQGGGMAWTAVRGGGHGGDFIQEGDERRARH